jgi:hypothetical protein
MEGIYRSIVNQTERYASNYYRTVGAGEGMNQLNSLGLQDTDPSLYEYTVKFIEQETSPKPPGRLAKWGVKARQFTYIFQLAGEVGQFFLNGIAQPLTITYPFFARPEFKMKVGELETQFVKAFGLASKAVVGRAPQEFQQIYDRMKLANLVGGEFSRALLEGTVRSETGIRFNHAISVFQRAGERTTRSQCAAMAYYVGKSKLGLSGDELYAFMADAIDFTQGRFGSGQNPGWARQDEWAKAIYQFSSFTSIWLETFAASVQAELKAGRYYAPAVTRQIIMLAVLTGTNGLPLWGILRFLLYALTGKDLSEEVAKLFANDKDIKDFVKYGATGQPGISSRTSMLSGDMLTSGRTGFLDVVPAGSTVKNIAEGAWDLAINRDLQGIQGLVPRAIRGPVRAYTREKEGLRSAGSPFPKIPKSKFGTQEFLLQSMSVTPKVVAKYYDQERFKKKMK